MITQEVDLEEVKGKGCSDPLVHAVVKSCVVYTGQSSSSVDESMSDLIWSTLL